MNDYDRTYIRDLLDAERSHYALMLNRGSIDVNTYRAWVAPIDAMLAVLDAS